MFANIEPYLSQAQKPARYVGGEWGSIQKDKHAVALRVAFCFPDTYEIGMSHLGLRILYDVMNRRDDVWCERAFTPWVDMEEILRRERIPLYALESGDALSCFDVLAFTLQYELSYTNVLNILELAGIPLRADKRDESHPLVIAGGPCAFNPEPMSDFIDLFAIGEGEELIEELLDVIRQGKQSGASRFELLKACARIDGVYVPALYEVTYRDDGTVDAVTPRHGAPAIVTKRLVANLNDAWLPEKPLVPNTEIVHDRVMLELFRGCIRGCRFCQAGYTTRPVRARDAALLFEKGMAAARASGADEISLTSLSTSDYRELEPLCDALLGFCEPRMVSLSLPSLRADSFSPKLLEKVQRVRKSGLTFAPEAGSARLRDVINKNLTEEDLLNACELAFAGGWSHVKLYFMLGLPTETEADVEAIAALAHRVYAHGKRTAANKARGIGVTVSASCFVPKPHTPFQWEAQDDKEAFLRKQTILKQTLRRQVAFRWHDADTSILEAALARGDRRQGAVIESAYRLGCRLDGWHECFSLERWQEAFAQNSLSLDWYAARPRLDTEILPWAHISAGVSQDVLRRERDRAIQGVSTPDCRTRCSGCGANTLTGGTCHG